MRNFTIIYLLGPDGTGKSAIAKKIGEQLSKHNHKVVHQWMRFNHLIAKLVNGLGHLTGLSEKVRYNENVIVGYHYYYKSIVLSWLYIASTILDFFLVYPFKIVWPMITGKFIILDRFIYDILVDLMIDTGISDLHKRWPGRVLRRVLPAGSACFLLTADIETIHARKPDTAYDRTHGQRCALYKTISEDFSIEEIENNSTIESPVRIILGKIHQ
jgi:hypothetical protein